MSAHVATEGKWARNAVAGLAWSLAALAPCLAHAQSMDYEGLERLFGEAVTTSVTGSPQRESDVPADMEIITADEIRQSGARDIPGILRHVAGLDVLQWSSDHADVAVRGYNQAASPRLLVLIDGRQVYENFYNDTVWRALPVELSEIQQIEVVRGPNSAQFGFNAVGGVINIITQTPSKTSTNTASITGGTQGTREGSAVVTAPIGNAAFVRLGLGQGVNTDFGSVRSQFGPSRQNSHSEANLSGRIALSHKIEAYLEATTSEVRRNAMLPIYSMVPIDLRTSSIRATLSLDSPWGLVGGGWYKNWDNLKVYKGGAITSDVDFVEAVSVTEIHDVIKINNNILRIALEQRTNTSETAPITGGRIFYDVLSLSGMWDWSITPKLSLTTAVRADRFALGRDGTLPPGYGLTRADWSRRTTQISYNAGIVWRAGDSDTVRLMAGRGVQLPSLYDLGAYIDQTPYGFLSGQPTTALTTVDNYEIHWNRDLPRYNAHVQLGLFHNRSSSLVAIIGGSLPSANIIISTRTVGDSQSTGGELSVTGKFRSHWRWGVSYTPQVITDHFLPGADPATTLVDFQHTQPVHVVNGNLGWSDGPWEIDGYARYESSFQGLRSNALLIGSLVRIPSYVSLDGRIAYRFRDHLTLALSGQNLGQARQIQTSAPAVERRVSATLTAAF